MSLLNWMHAIKHFKIVSKVRPSHMLLPFHVCFVCSGDGKSASSFALLLLWNNHGACFLRCGPDLTLMLWLAELAASNLLRQQGEGGGGVGAKQPALRWLVFWEFCSLSPTLCRFLPKLAPFDFSREKRPGHQSVFFRDFINGKLPTHSLRCLHTRPTCGKRVTPSATRKRRFGWHTSL